LDDADEMTGREATAIRDPLIGGTVLGYTITRTIGVGGMGKVYEALEPNIGRRAAVKVLLPAVANDPEFVARLKSEARAANAARHRGIIDIFGFAPLPDGRQAIIMEFLEGVPLDEELLRLSREGQRLSVAQSLEVLDEVASVLQAAHGASVTHRDLKPSNIFLCSSSDGSRYVKVLDFGVAKLDNFHASPKTAANVVMGTPSYMAPEQAAGEAAAPSMDLYALGVIAFELFTGRLPFEQEGVVQLLLAHQQIAPPVPSSLAPGLPAGIDDFVLKLLEKSPANRFQSGAEVRAEIKRLQSAPVRALRATDEVRALPTIVHERVITAPGPTNASSPKARLALVAAAVLALVGVGSVVFPGGPEPVAPPPAPVVPVPVPLVVPPLPPVVPVVESPPVQAVEPTAAAVEPAPAQPVVSALETRRKALDRRLSSLGGRLARAVRRGDSVALETQQLDKLKAAFKGARDARLLDQIDTALQRLEQENP
jgi:serine/threonine-protein kinase